MKLVKKMAVVGVLFAAACGGSSSSNNNPNPDGGTNPGSDSGTPGGGGGSGWTKMELTGDHMDDDFVTGIAYSSPTTGVVVTTAHESANNGAVFTASANAITKLAFDGDLETPAGALGGVDFTGVAATPTGFIAMTEDSDVVVGDASLNFTIGVNGTANLGFNDELGIRVTAAGTTLVADGVIWTSPSAPSATAVYTALWAPEATPTIPNPIPAGRCPAASRFANGLHTSADTYIGTDGSQILYTFRDDGDNSVGVCTSSDRGKTVTPVLFTGLGADAGEIAPSGLAMASGTVGVAYGASSTGDPSNNYIVRTTDGGAHWASVALPSAISAASIDLDGAFFAPDALHGWIVGYNHDAMGALIMVTADGGATWTMDSSGAASAAGDTRLWTGFALDTTHVWLGGEAGTVLAFHAS